MLLASLFVDNYIIILYGDRKWIPMSKGKSILYFVVRIAFHFVAKKSARLSAHFRDFLKYLVIAFPKTSFMF